MSAGRVASGAVAGAVATVVMSGVMLAAERAGLVSRPAPEVVTAGVLDAAGSDRTEGSQRLLAGFSHFAYGSGAGAVFATVAPRLPISPRWLGPAYGLLLCVAGYQGWVPAAALMPPLHRQASARRGTLVAAHLVYGAVLGALVAPGDGPVGDGAGDGR